MVPGGGLDATALAQWTVGGRTVGVDQPLVLAVLPVAVVVLAVVLLRRRPTAAADRRSRYLLFGARVVVVGCLLVAAAGPYTLTEETVVSNPQVTLLVDDSKSMELYDVEADRLASAIETAGVPVSRSTIGSGNESRIGDGIVSAVAAGGNVLVLSDGRVTTGRSIAAAAEFARSVNATISRVDLGPPATERAVRVAAPPKTTVGVEATISVAIDGVEADGEVPVTVEIDGQEVARTVVEGTGSIQLSHVFETPGDHRIVARALAEDRIDANDVAYRTVRVVEPPSILYVARGEYPFRDLLERLYDVTVAESVPTTLDPYTAVVVQDVRAADVGDLDALRSFVTAGNGLVVAGGANAFENGGYGQSPLSTLLPVQSGAASGGGATVLLTIDVSGSTAGGMTTQKALALDVLDQLDDDDRVGIVAFDTRAYLVARPQSLAVSRQALETQIRRLQSGGGTSIAAGLRGAGEVLAGDGGNVVLLTDGLDPSAGVVATARRLADEAVRVITIGVGDRIDETLLRSIAAETGGTYLRASEASRLRVLFGDRPRTPSGGLTVVDSGHFVTSGITPTANPSEAHAVSVKRGADFLVATGSGAPAITAWRFGLGRVVTVTAFGSDGTLDGLLGQPDSALLSRSVNWAIGDPERSSTGLISLADTRLGEPTTAVYVGPQRPTAAEIQFVRVGADRYEATVVPTSQGFQTVLDRPFAVDYPAELGSFGPDPALAAATELTGGRTFDVDQSAAIAAFVRQRATVARTVRTGWAWPWLIAAIVVFLLDVAARRLQVYGPGDTTVG